MSSFTDVPQFEPLVNGKEWRVTKGFIYYLDGDKMQLGGYVKVPEGFVTDFASVPRLFWNILPPWGVYGKAAVVHDFLYQYKTYVDAYGMTRKATKDFADITFFNAMSVLDVKPWKKKVMYFAVKYFGNKAWRT